MIFNASSRPLSKNPGTLPDVSDALLNYFQKMVFTRITKQIINFKNVEVPIDTDFLGVWQPFTDQQLQMKSEGQRKWKWFLLHADPSLSLKPDEVVNYQNVQYRVMAKKDYTNYGYIEYHLINDYTGAGP